VPYVCEKSEIILHHLAQTLDITGVYDRFQLFLDGGRAIYPGRNYQNEFGWILIGKYIDYAENFNEAIQADVGYIVGYYKLGDIPSFIFYCELNIQNRQQLMAFQAWWSPFRFSVWIALGVSTLLIPLAVEMKHLSSNFRYSLNVFVHRYVNTLGLEIDRPSR